jgi:phosphatidylserine/phosphatidylglycerophosphate/cardiolipin synthase-like enzyme
VYFAPNGGATEAVIRELNAAKTQVLMQAYSFTSAPIAKALVEAHKHGVKVLAVLDKSNETAKYSAATFLSNAGMPPLIDDQHAIAHNAVLSPSDPLAPSRTSEGDRPPTSESNPAHPDTHRPRVSTSRQTSPNDAHPQESCRRA